VIQPRCQPKLFVNGVAGNAQAAGGFGDVSSGLFPGCYDLVDDRPFQGRGGGRCGRRGGAVEVFRSYDGSVGDNRQTGQDAAQFADVAGPGALCQQGQRRVGD